MSWIAPRNGGYQPGRTAQPRREPTASVWAELCDAWRNNTPIVRMARRPRTIPVTFHRDTFELPRNWRPDQVAHFLEQWQQNKLSQPHMSTNITVGHIGATASAEAMARAQRQHRAALKAAGHAW